MNVIRQVMLGVLATILLIALTVQAEASTKKSSKPIVRVVNGTVLVNYPEDKKG